MTEDQRELLEKARSSLEAAKWLLEGAYPDFAASRVYYAMFYVAQAFLEGEGLALSEHSAEIAAFGQHFARAGKVPVEFPRFLLAAQDVRHISQGNSLADPHPFKSKTLRGNYLNHRSPDIPQCLVHSGEY